MNSASTEANMPPAGTTSRLLVVVATYNERDNLPALAEQIFEAVPDATLLVVDDNSPDGTGEWAEERARSEPRLCVQHRPRKMGLGSAILHAMDFARTHDFDLLLNLDADFSHSPRDIPRLVAGTTAANGRSKVDVMIGSRYVAGGRTVGWPWYRRWMSWALNALTRRLLRIPVSDCSSGFRCFRVDLLRRLDLSRIRATGYAFHEEVLWHARRAGATFGETPIEFVDRRRGHSKINAAEALAALWTLVRLGMRERLGKRPPVPSIPSKPDCRVSSGS